ncbi:cell wall-binding repeat-containing protein [Mobiluncus mulieris]|uniref:Cell wall-binding repeat-containing protein n=2 Tax=Mobiluncus mulieris TaxID=2052 RepID=A0ABD4U1P8_9ACTO|nr:cell wall-binding repeat-containing protein [Mobiluncus mulieris]MCU9974173.1 cell wall-binding repeat-containing protein [Mobiluncus mulieris]MCV0010318.1 cell wall-binding repeat-containing protein [Mobiluncus mulieris]NMW76014.1 trypsin-like serine protease [Mobiluncus mulieris]
METMAEKTVSKRGLVAVLAFTALLGLSGLSQPGTAAAVDTPGQAPRESAAPTQWHPLTTPRETPVESAPETGETQAGQLPDPHPATVQLQIGPEVGVFSACSGVWVAPDRVLTAKHCFQKFPNGPVRVYPQNSQVPGTPPVARGVTWATPGNTDLAVLITNPSNHPIAPVNPTVLNPGTPTQICGQNYLVAVNLDLKGESTTIPGKANHCANVATLDAANAVKWQLPPSGQTIATLPLSIEHGDSGGPMYNQAGQVVGITSSKTQLVLNTGEKLVLNASVSLYPYAQWLAQMGVPVTGQSQALTPKPLPPNVMRIAGPNRLATAAAAVDATPGAETLVVTTGLNAADGLAATQLSGVTASALALSNSRDRLDADALRVIQQHGFKRVVRVGGTVGLSGADRALIASRGMDLVELVGVNRFETAVKVAQYRDQLAGGAPSYVMLADGINFPDALAAGAVAGHMHGSLVLTAGGQLPDASREYLESQSGVPLVVVGGPADRARNALGLQSSHVYVGRDRYETAMQLAIGIQSPGGINGLVLVSGRDFPDALAAGAYAVKQGAMLLLVPPAGSKSALLADLWDVTGRHGVIVGGQAAVSDLDVAYAVTR